MNQRSKRFTDKSSGNIRRNGVRMACLIIALCSGAARAQAAASIMLWPLNPVIPANAPAAALWIENRGTAPANLQIRVLGWSQRDFADHYDHQQEQVFGSPPFAVIAPGKRQLVRLLRAHELAAGEEQAFRVLIDEIPDAPVTASAPTGIDSGTSGANASAAAQPVDSAASQAAASFGINYKIRYSIPLFVYGNGLAPADPPPNIRLPHGTRHSQAQLDWRFEHHGAQRWLRLRNRGLVHARLTHLTLLVGNTPLELGSVLLGYVLPQAEMRWPVPDSISIEQVTAVQASVNGQETMLARSVQ
ncbi:MAG: fimbrial biogenesis chaperone [Janthinobacterium lividum]